MCVTTNSQKKNAVLLIEIKKIMYMQIGCRVFWAALVCADSADPRLLREDIVEPTIRFRMPRGGGLVLSFGEGVFSSVTSVESAESEGECVRGRAKCSSPKFWSCFGDLLCFSVSNTPSNDFRPFESFFFPMGIEYLLLFICKLLLPRVALNAKRLSLFINDKKSFVLKKKI